MVQTIAVQSWRGGEKGKGYLRKAREDVEERRLSSARWTHDRRQFARTKLSIHAVEDFVRHCKIKHSHVELLFFKIYLCKE